jgi:hypothetical protein
MLILPALALASAMNSGTVLAGTDGLTTVTYGSLPRLATDAMSRMNSKFSLSLSVALIAFGTPTNRSV